MSSSEIVKNSFTCERWCYGFIVVPVDPDFIFHRFFIGEVLLADFLLAKSSRIFTYSYCVFLKAWFLVITHQVTGNSHASGCIQYMDHAIIILGAIFTAVCVLDVVAPPMSSGCFMPLLFISCAT